MVSSSKRAIFTGGTGRSGTTVLGSLLGNHSQVWATLPREIRFLTDNYGLLDLSVGGTFRSKLPTPILTAVFMQKLKSEWWERTGPDGSARGLHRGILRTEFEVALEYFRTSKQPLADKAAAFVHLMMDPATERNGATIWVDTTPANAMNADRILTLLPEASVIHVVRDGRDACASVVTKKWGPKDHLSALDWWRRRMLLSHKGMSAAPANKSMTVVLENLLLHSRETTYKDLLRFIGVDDQGPMAQFFSNNMTADRGHIGRWRSEVPAGIRANFAAKYEDIWQELDEQEVPLAPLN